MECPVLQALNPGVSLPDLPVTIIHRSDGSGTTFNFTAFLSAWSAEWKEKIGSDTRVKWPAGIGADGSSRLIRAVQDTPGALGYVEYGQVVRASLKYPLLQNRDGAFVQPNLGSFQAASQSASWDPAKDFELSLIDTPGSKSWPIVAVTYVYLRESPVSAARQRNVATLFDLAFTRGSEHAVALGYAPLPADLIAKIKNYWTSSPTN